MMLESFGCSFIWGSELPDEITRYQHSNLTWPALVAQELNYDYLCHARGGAGNFYISQQILAQIERRRNADSLFVINWSWIDRFDYFQADPIAQWSTVRPAEHSSVNEFYYRELHSQLQDKLMSLSYINLCLDQLEHAGIPYISCYMDDLLYETQWHTNAAIYLMQKNTRHRMTEFNGENFVKWAQTLNYPITPSGHLLESGHAAVAQEILQRLRVNEIKTACS